MTMVRICSQDGQRLRANFHGLSPTVDMLVIVTRLPEGTGQQRVVAFPYARGLGRKNLGQAGITWTELHWIVPQQEMVLKGRHPEKVRRSSVDPQRLPPMIGLSQLVGGGAEGSQKRREHWVAFHTARELISCQGD